MPVCRRHFARLDELKRKQDGVAGHLGFRQARINQPDDTPLDTAAADGDFLFSLNQTIVNIVPLPKMWLDPCLGIGRPFGVIEIPQSGNPAAAQEIIQLFDFF
jgi:hypothetical protein